MLIAVSGNIGSGKTTLARYLSSKYELRYVPYERLEFGFLEDFFRDIEGTFLPTQLSFLISKAVELQKLLHNQENIVLDRSLLEDIDVFARLWIENRNIDTKIVELYNSTANFIYQSLPEPDLYIFCRCPAHISRQRIALRSPRGFEAQYPPHHIELLARYYEELISSLNAPCVEIDTERYDFTEQGILPDLCNKIFDQFSNRPHFGQFSLFEDSIEVATPGLTFHHFNQNYSQQPPPNRPSPYIYLAAPFTQMAPPEKLSRTDEINLFSSLGDGPTYGRLNAAYQNKLKKIEQALVKQCQMPVHLPHRDINNWGKTSYPTEYLTPRLVDTVEKAAAIVAIPGSSIGVHLELGIGIARHIPIVIFETADLTNSFFVRGFQELSTVKYVKVPSLSKIPSYISAGNLTPFLVENRIARSL